MQKKISKFQNFYSCVAFFSCAPQAFVSLLSFSNNSLNFRKSLSKYIFLFAQIVAGNSVAGSSLPGVPDPVNYIYDLILIFKDIIEGIIEEGGVRCVYEKYEWVMKNKGSGQLCHRINIYGENNTVTTIFYFNCFTRLNAKKNLQL